MRHALIMAPLKSKHQILLEYSKVAFFCHYQPLACSILSKAIHDYPDEWKLELEYILQIVCIGSSDHI